MRQQWAGVKGDGSGPALVHGASIRRCCDRTSYRRDAVPGGLARIVAATDTAPFLARAFALRDQAIAAGDQGFCAVVVKDGRFVGEGPSRVVVAGDPTAHAESEAIRDAAKRLRSS